MEKQPGANQQQYLEQQKKESLSQLKPENIDISNLIMTSYKSYKNIYYIQKNSILFHIACPLCDNNLSYYYIESNNDYSSILPYVITTAIVSFITIHLFFKL